MRLYDQAAGTAAAMLLVLAASAITIVALLLVHADAYWKTMAAGEMITSLLLFLAIIAALMCLKETLGQARAVRFGTTIAATGLGYLITIATAGILSLMKEPAGGLLAAFAGAELALALTSVSAELVRTMNESLAGNEGAAMTAEAGCEPFIGLRCWGVADMGSVAILRSIHRDDVYWPAGRPTEGDPCESARTGVNAFRTKKDLLDFFRKRRSAEVAGRVALWGDVIEHEKGYRAQYGYPTELYAKDRRTADMLERFYGCKTGVMSEDLRELDLDGTKKEGNLA